MVTGCLLKARLKNEVTTPYEIARCLKIFVGWTLPTIP